MLDLEDQFGNRQVMMARKGTQNRKTCSDRESEEMERRFQNSLGPIW